jgi:predicted RNase H-like HicB family nuclease
MNIQTLIKLASIIVHADEFINSNQGHQNDKEAINALLKEEDVKLFLSHLDKQSLLPVRRDGVRYVLDIDYKLNSVIETYQFSVELAEEGGWLASSLDFPGINAQGETLDELRVDMLSALSDMIDYRRKYIQVQ